MIPNKAIKIILPNFNPSPEAMLNTNPAIGAKKEKKAKK